MHPEHLPRWARRAGLSFFLVLLTSTYLFLAGSALAEGEEPSLSVELLNDRPHPSPDLIAQDEDARPPADRYRRPANLGLQLYIVAEGDTLSRIAETFGLQQNSIVWANPTLQANPSSLQVGQELWLPPIDGAVHTVAAGDNLTGIALRYGVSANDIVFSFYNSILDPHRLQIGDKILVPGGTRPIQNPRRTVYHGVIPQDALTGSGQLIWPVIGRITQGYRAGHRAIDIGAPRRRVIVAADAGFVIRSGWDHSGYGILVVIDHGNGIQTLYAHLNDIRVQAGQSVSAGATIGTVGRTGNTTGPHLHFEVLVHGARKNPLDYLP